ncbi:MAG: hypothetical protein COA78_29930 [Blastopirellula sp.]|nr:MAG: hypothetical protein COA78_29930 [Blastopirellula sp.]
MYDSFFKIQNELEPNLRKGDLDSCIERVINELKSIPDSPFHDAIKMVITNPVEEVAQYFDKFFETEAARFTLEAAYAETNGFNINPDLWYFDVFAFSSYGGLSDFEWLSEWQSDYFPPMQITGFEKLQEVYGSDAFHNSEFDAASSIAGLLFLIRFQELIKRASVKMKHLKFPLLATAHDYEFFYQTPTGIRNEE